MVILEASRLSKTFRTRESVIEAVTGVDLQVQYGDIFGFLGPNGAGKSTTVRMLTTLLRPSSGQAIIAGYDLLRQAPHIRQQIGYVSQTGGADANATATENVILQARMYGMSYSIAAERSQALMDTLQLKSCATRLVKTFSGGQRRRLDLALGMVHKPSLLFLDEPTASLDAQSRARLWDEMRRLCAEGITIFLTTHYLEEADMLCNRLAIIDHGEIVAEGTPDMLKRQIAGDVITIGLNAATGDLTYVREVLCLQPFVREVHSRKDGLRLYVDQGEQVLPNIMRIIDGIGVPIQTIALTRPTLEDVFLRQTGRALRETTRNQDDRDNHGVSQHAIYAKDGDDEVLS